jgi:threonine/homoserine/homoserine lactone efflux protein
VDLESFRKGVIIGFAVAAPVGPIGVLVIQRSLQSALVGLSTGLGAAAADALYALAGALATAFVLRILAATWVMELIGAAVLAWLAVRTWIQHSTNREQGDASGVRPGLVRSFGETLFLTLANPATILSFAAVAASQGFGARARAYVFAAGVFIGSAAWWLLLSAGVRFGSRRLSPRTFRNIHLASGAVLATFAVLAFAKALSDF